MSEAEPLIAILRQSADTDVVAAIERLVRDASDRDLCRINALAFAAREALDEERCIAAFLHAARIGLFELSWNVLCPGCGGVLDTNASLKSVRADTYNCALCAAGYEATLDEMVEVTFTVNPRVRLIAAHDPHNLPFYEYSRQIFFGSGVDLPGENYAAAMKEMTLEGVELPAGDKAIVSLDLPAEFVIVFDQVTHAALFIDVKGEPTTQRRNISIVYNGVSVPTGTMEMQPGPVRVTFENRSANRVLPSI